VIIPIFSFGKKNQITPIKGFVAENNTTFRLKDVKELVYGGFGRITKEAWAKAEDHVLKIEKEYGKENCIDEFLKFDFFIKLFFSFKGLKRNVVF
jgi:hypothetical protein